MRRISPSSEPIFTTRIDAVDGIVKPVRNGKTTTDLSVVKQWHKEGRLVLFGQNKFRMDNGKSQKEINPRHNTIEDVLRWYDKGYTLEKAKKKEEERLVDKLHNILTDVADVLEPTNAQKANYFRNAEPYQDGKLLVVDFPTSCNLVKSTAEEFKLAGINLIIISESDNGIYDAPNHIPVSSEGEKGFRLQFRKMAFSFGSAVGKTSFDDIAYNPGVITDAEKNQQFQEINISFNPANPGTVHLKRSTKITGALKASEQKNLLLFEDELNAERENLGLKKTFLDELKENKKTRSLADEYSNAFAQARKEYKTYFENEVKAEFDMQPENLTDYKVIQSGRFINKPEMIYSSEFDLTGLIKKAGKNYIFETGKLIGSQVKIIPEQRDRNVDVYMANTRSYKNKIIFSIPDGYSIEGLDKLNVSVNNETGAFNASALVNNGILTIETEKKYSNPVLKAEQWPLLLKVIDAANDFTNSRILLRKN